MAGVNRVEPVDDEAARWDDRAALRACLQETPPRIPAWYGYDEVGSEMWEELSSRPASATPIPA